jgi:hypothetical protein
MEDRLKIRIKPDELKKVDDALKAVEAAIGNYLVALTPKERQELPKMGDKSFPFVSKVLDYSESNKEFTPPYVDTAEMKRDFKAVDDLQSRARKLRQILSNVDDTVTLAGSEAYVAALSYYNSVKLASKLSVPNAKTIFEDLRVRFEQSNESTKEENTL